MMIFDSLQKQLEAERELLGRNAFMAAAADKALSMESFRRALADDRSPWADAQKQLLCEMRGG